MKHNTTGRNLRRVLAVSAALVLAALFVGCGGPLGLFGGDDDELSFELSAPSEVSSNEEFTVEVTDATLTDGGSFAWTFSGPGDVTFNGETVSSDDGALTSGSDITSVTLAAVTNGSYTVTLRVEADGSFHESSATINVAGGAIELTGPITSDTELVDVVLQGADYIINSDLEISATLSLPFGNARRIEVADGAGIIVKDGGTLQAKNTTFAAANSGWKGILVQDGGTLDFDQVSIAGAAASTFDTHKASALVFESGASVFPDFDVVSVENTTGLNVYIEDYMSSLSNAGNLTLFSPTPYDIPFKMLNAVQNRVIVDSSVSGSTTGVLRGEGDSAVTVIPGGGTIIPYQLDNYVIEGGLTLADDQGLSFQSGTTVSFEAGSGLSLANMLVSASDETVTLQGVDGASWNGVSVDSLNISSGDTLVIKDAAGTLIPGSSTETAALIIDRDGVSSSGPDTFFGLAGNLTVNVVAGTADYGIYQSAANGPDFNGSTSTTLTVSNAKTAGISIFPHTLPILAGSVTITMPDASNQPAVELRERWGNTTDLSADLTIPSLGADNFYSIVVDPVFRFPTSSATRTITFEDGADVRFASGASLTIQGDTNDVAAFAGSSGTGVVFQPDGSLSAADYWQGIHVDLSKIEMDYTTVSGGGSAALGGNANAANLLVSDLVDDADSFIKNSAFNNGGGYGIVVENGSGAGFTETDLSTGGTSGNSFSINTSGEVLIQ